MSGEYIPSVTPPLSSCGPTQLFDVTPEMVSTGASALTYLELAWASYEEISKGVLQAAAQSAPRPERRSEVSNQSHSIFNAWLAHR